MPADAVSNRANAVLQHRAVVLDDGVVVPGRRDKVESPAIVPPVAGAFEPRQKIAVEQPFHHGVPACVPTG
jgi:hypothetical protein